jgi:hypothetical protein
VDSGAEVFAVDGGVEASRVHAAAPINTSRTGSHDVRADLRVLFMIAVSLFDERRDITSP